MVGATKRDVGAIVVCIDGAGDGRIWKFATRLQDANRNLAAVCNEKALDGPLDRWHSGLKQELVRRLRRDPTDLVPKAMLRAIDSPGSTHRISNRFDRADHRALEGVAPCTFNSPASVIWSNWGGKGISVPRCADSCGLLLSFL